MFSVQKRLDDSDAVRLHGMPDVHDGRVEAVQDGANQNGHAGPLKKVLDATFWAKDHETLLEPSFY